MRPVHLTSSPSLIWEYSPRRIAPTLSSSRLFLRAGLQPVPRAAVQKLVAYPGHESTDYGRIDFSLQRDALARQGGQMTGQSLPVRVVEVHGGGHCGVLYSLVGVGHTVELGCDPLHDSERLFGDQEVGQVEGKLTQPRKTRGGQIRLVVQAYLRVFENGPQLGIGQGVRDRTQLRPPLVDFPVLRRDLEHCLGISPGRTACRH